MGERHSGCPAECCDEKAFSQNLPRDSPLTRPKRRAERELSAPTIHAREREIRDVATRDEQYESNGGQRQAERSRRVTDDPVSKRNHRDPSIRVRPRMLACKLGGDAAEISAGAADGHTRFETGDRVVPPRRSERDFHRVEDLRREELLLHPGLEEAEFAR